MDLTVPFVQILAIAAFISVLLGFTTTLVRTIRGTGEAERQTSERVKAAETKADAEPEKAKPAWDLARATLDAYFNRNLAQITQIFWLSVMVMLLGFAIVAWGIVEALQAPDSLPVATVATAAGVITEFIGATFLFLYRSTIEQAVGYAKTLERINSVGMAMQILDTMADGAPADDLKSATKAKLAQALIERYGSAAP